MPTPIFRSDLEMRKQEAGFTIIELVVVIILLGIMAATALPRFMDVTDEAHTSVVNGVQGGLLSGMSLYRAQWIAEGEPLKDTIIVDFGSLRVNDAGYPYGTADNSGGTSTVTDEDDCVAVFQNVLQAGAPDITARAAAANVIGNTTDFAGVAAAPNCVYYYTGKISASGDTIPTLTYSSTTGSVVLATATLP
ncbi:MAG: prepilin-type N-terminal cleavage/methylation domain-containing protein [Candidatus Azotimanducaceae bacterium]|jgi:prepilin-type N-terminal cleavage/methylation domain-containing protein